MTAGRRRIETMFKRMRAENRAALMPFITGGHPAIEHLGPLIRAVERGGASAVEVGIPFSDPIADGPVVAASMHEALQRGVTPNAIFDAVAAIRDDTDMPVIAMVSISIVDRIGVGRFVEQAAGAGFDGLIVPDLDVDDSDALAAAVDQHGLALAMLVAPTATNDRVRRLVEQCRGFVYVLARAGITGEQDAAPNVDRRIAELRAVTDLPLAVGFGISTAAHVRAATASADAAIVGSALVRRLGDAADPPAEAERFTAELAEGLRGSASTHPDAATGDRM